MSTITVKNLNKSYGNKHILKDISLTIQSGETIGILGENGAGKTTLIECMEGIRNMNSGSIFIDQYAPKIALSKGIFGVQTQVASLPNEIKVKEILDVVSSWNNLKTYDRKNDVFDLCSVYDKQYGQLSIGWKRKLHLTLSLINQPSVIFLDEPTAGLDVKARLQFHQIIQKLKQQGKTIVLTSHDIAEINMLCDKICFIKDGKIIFFGTIQSLNSQLLKDYRLSVNYENEKPKEQYIIKDLRKSLLSTLSTILDENHEISSIHVEHSSLEETFIQMMEGIR